MSSEKWEYRVESVKVNEKWNSKNQEKEFEKLRNQLNLLGEEGWEMISYESIPMIGSFTGNLKGYSYLVFFKRKK